MRHADWPTRLNAYIDARRYAHFNWGEHDCATFAAGAVEAITGQRPHMPTWRSVREAMRVERNEGGIDAALSRRFEQQSVAATRRGDLVLIHETNKRAPAVAVCVGDHWCCPGTMELVFGSMMTARASWRVD